MSVSSFLVVIFEYEKPDVLKAGLNYLVQMHVGVVFLIAAFLLLQTETGSGSFDALRGYFATHGNFLMFFLFFVGFGIKAGFVPLHSWLPHAHPAAPSHVSGVMSGVMIKMGIYGILRVLGYVQAEQAEIGYFILAIALLTGVYGIVNAIMQRDLKRMLAFHSLENIGIIGIGIGLGMIGLGIHDQTLAFMGFAGGILHVFNHSLFKSQLFFGAGSVYTATHTRNIEQLGGLIKKMPWTGVFFLIASLSISGLPPFNGFISEFLIYKGMFGALSAQNITTEVYLLITVIALVLIGGMAVYAFTKAFGLIFTGVERSEKTAHAVEADGFMLAPQFIITAVIITIGLFPAPFLHIVSLPIAQFLPDYQPALANSTGVLEQVGKVGFVFLALTAVIFGIRTIVVKKNGEAYGPTWGCGYLAGNSRMQYTDASFVDYFAKLAHNMIGFTVSYKPIARPDIFPADRPFDTHVHDTIEQNWLHKPLRWLARLLDLLTFLQRGQMQAYLLYGIVFIVVMVVITVLDII
jgi:hydrogenase-4 component B